jgi:hypothetical protein
MPTPKLPVVPSPPGRAPQEGEDVMLDRFDLACSGLEAANWQERPGKGLGEKGWG